MFKSSFVTIYPSPSPATNLGYKKITKLKVFIDFIVLLKEYYIQIFCDGGATVKVFLKLCLIALFK